jgi:hypothetical protein
MEQKQELIVGYFLVAIAIGLLAWIGFHNSTHKHTLDDFYHALATVETNNNDYARGSHSERGRWQVTPAYFQDSVEFADLDVTFDDLVVPSVGRTIIKCYMLRYAPDAWHNEDWHSLARIHHGGWNGMNREHTKAYADRVVAIMGAE